MINQKSKVVGSQTGFSTQGLSLLRYLSQNRSSGCVQVTLNGLQWSIYFEEGRLKYVFNSSQSLELLEDYIRYLGYSTALFLHKNFPQELLRTGSFDQKLIQAVVWHQKQGSVTPQQAARLLESLTENALEPLLWIPSFEGSWISSVSTSSLIAQLEIGGVELEPLLNSLSSRHQIWQRFSPLISSPHQRPYLFNLQAQDSVLLKLKELMRGLSFQRIARLLKQPDFKVAQLLYPYLQKGIVVLRDPINPLDRLPSISAAPLTPTPIVSVPQDPLYRIVCIDDSPLVLNQIEKFLGRDQFEVIKIDNPIQASNQIFKLKPDLILLDITMPEINGYKLCSLFRGSTTLSHTPIVMVSGNTGIIDKARASISGATDYLTKPFTREELLALVSKHLKIMLT
jgi:twitching motility two-component system response regulator PilG